MGKILKPLEIGEIDQHSQRISCRFFSFAWNYLELQISSQLNPHWSMHDERWCGVPHFIKLLGRPYPVLHRELTGVASSAYYLLWSDLFCATSLFFFLTALKKSPDFESVRPSIKWCYLTMLPCSLSLRSLQSWGPLAVQTRCLIIPHCGAV